MKQLVAVIFLVVCIFAPFVAAERYSWWYFFPTGVVCFLLVLWAGNAGLYDKSS